ncbi:hypothetical protein PHAVU_001G141600 [Phaseolus vulgaris]|uniref:HTH myb-type domain-containing protein n=1 Tax=Phaseolus vulgaris TaxID=3885 RepID=V7CVV7_PHAVU|nr:hypothetical protein PHAVU_001G141600g [Phaseolus vulgaris]ESW34307.1 hypothetical protein PHAVU_001G141600g [Phaseolus vulgaris]
MNENKVHWGGLIQQTHGLSGDFNSEFGNHYCQYFDIRQAWNMGPLAMVGGEATDQLPNIGHVKSSGTIISRFESPASAFYATENCMGFAEYDCQVGIQPQLSKINDLEFPLYQSPRENLFLDSANQPDSSYDLSNTLQSIVKSQLNNNQCRVSPESSSKISCGNFPTTKFLPIEQQKLFIDGVIRGSSFPNKGSQDHMVACGSFNLPVAHLRFSSEIEKLSPTLSAASVSTVGNSASNGAVVSSKTRIRWAKDLHEKFVECVNRLGGSEHATPKAILKMMDTDGLTIFHVKSHLQKYRIAKFIPEPSQGKSDKRTHTKNLHHLDVKTGLQIREALKLQLDAQRCLHEQLEVQRKLQLRIEEQGRQLKKMFDQQQKTSNNLLYAHDSATDETTITHKDGEVSVSEGANNSFFTSKASPSQ